MLEFDKMYSLISIIMIVSFIALVVIIVGFIIYGQYYNKKIKEKRPKITFELLDVFFFIYLNNGDSHTTTFAVIRDIVSQKIYAIPDPTISGAGIEYIGTDVKFVRYNKSKKEYVEVKINDRGSLWIDKEYKKCPYSRIEEKIKIFNNKLEYKREVEGKFLRNNVLYNINKNYDYTLLDKATFVYGLAEFNEDVE